MTGYRKLIGAIVTDILLVIFVKDPEWLTIGLLASLTVFTGGNIVEWFKK